MSGQQHSGGTSLAGVDPKAPNLELRPVPDASVHGGVDDPMGYVALRSAGGPRLLSAQELEHYDREGFVSGSLPPSPPSAPRWISQLECVAMRDATWHRRSFPSAAWMRRRLPRCSARSREWRNGSAAQPTRSGRCT
jgi:hypothetical protein